jgi:membrane protein implicated in regulation of membrane protease activity
MQKERESSSYSSAPIFSSARFDEDSAIIYPILILATAGLYFSGFRYFVLIPALVLVSIFAIEASERVTLVSSKKGVLIPGRKCVIVKRVSLGENGVVKVIDDAGTPQWELWSAQTTNHDFEEGSIARVKRIDGLFLQIEPLKNHET